VLKKHSLLLSILIWLLSVVLLNILVGIVILFLMMNRNLKMNKIIILRKHTNPKPLIDSRVHKATKPVQNLKSSTEIHTSGQELE